MGIPISIIGKEGVDSNNHVSSNSSSSSSFSDDNSFYDQNYWSYRRRND